MRENIRQQQQNNPTADRDAYSQSSQLDFNSYNFQFITISPLWFDFKKNKEQNNGKAYSLPNKSNFAPSPHLVETNMVTVFPIDFVAAVRV